MLYVSSSIVVHLQKRGFVMSVIKQKHVHVQTLFSLQLWKQQVHVSAVDE